MTHKMRSAWVVSASTMTGSAIAGAILSAAIISRNPATAAEPWPNAEMKELIYSPWAKFCSKGKDPGAKEVCFTGKYARTELGQRVVTAILAELEGEPKKLFRVTLPGSLEVRYGTRIIFDKETPINDGSFTCVYL